MIILIVYTAKYLFILSILLYLYVLLKFPKKNKKNFLWFSIFTFSLSFITSKISGLFINDPRPFVIEHVKPLISHAADNGFPSDHMLLTMTIASVVFVYNKKYGVVLTIIAICVGTARVMAKLHHVEDILGSMIIAIIATVFIYKIFPSLLDSRKIDRKIEP